MQKLKVPSGENTELKRLNVLSLKPGVGQYIAIHAAFTARDFFLTSTLLVHSPAFFPKTSPDFFLWWQWLTLVPVKAHRIK